MALDIDGLILQPCLAIFGEDVPATYTSSALGFAPFAIVGVFDKGYRAIDVLSGDLGASSATPVLGVRIADFPVGATPRVNDRVTVASIGLTYIVNTVEPDGHGWCKLILNLAAVQP